MKLITNRSVLYESTWRDCYLVKSEGAYYIVSPYGICDFDITTNTKDEEAKFFFEMMNNVDIRMRVMNSKEVIK